MLSDGDIKFNYGLTPLSFLYGLGVRLRNQLFDWGILPTEKFSVPVICIGNLAVGGTGKTPHIEYVIRLLRRRYKIAVVSRGYKRKTTGYILATPDNESKEIGDEPYQILQKFPDLIFAIDNDRRRAIRNLLSLPEEKRPEVILLDDGFQHRYVKPSLSVILTDYHRLFYDDKLLPVGRLRDFPIMARRADIVIVTKCEKDIKPIEFRIMEDHMQLLAHQELLFTRIVYSDLQPVFRDLAVPRVLRDIRRDDEVLLISGIVNPLPLENELKKYSKKVVSETFPDHHEFTKKDFHNLSEIFDRMKSPEKLIVVTEKDAARLRNNPDVPEEWKKHVYALPISIAFFGKKENLFDEAILKHIETIKQKGLPE